MAVFGYLSSSVAAISFLHTRHYNAFSISLLASLADSHVIFTYYPVDTFAAGTTVLVDFNPLIHAMMSFLE